VITFCAAPFAVLTYTPTAQTWCATRIHVLWVALR
jgi:hypothetical protein